VRTGRRLLTATIALAIVAVFAPSTAGATSVTVVVESTDPARTLFSGSVETTVHPVDGSDGSGPHRCSGPPGGVPSPTATGALDDAMRGAGIAWRGNWDPSFEDFFVDRIGPYASAPPDEYWALSVNGSFASGGCLATVAAGDTVRFAYGPLFAAGTEGAPDGSGGAGSPDSGSALPGGGSKGAAGATGKHVSARRLRRLIRRSLRFLRGARGTGDDWAGLVLALRRRRAPTGEAGGLARRLRRLPRGRPTGEDVDFTALAAWSLAVRGRRAAARRAAITVRDAQSADGGFPAVPGGDSNAQSTGVALIALRVAGLGPRPSTRPGGPTPLDYLASLARRDGSFAYAPGSRPTPVWTTAQALLGLTARGRLLGLGGTRAAG
jgi:hypothetical protein